MQKIDILYYSCPYDLSGYGTVSRNHLLNLRRCKNLNIRLRVKKFWTGIAPDLGEDREVLRSMERTVLTKSKDFIFIQHLTPENFFIDPRAKYHLAYTPFETDGAPLSWLLPLRGLDEIWVPSKHNKAAYIKAGISADKIQVIPHGVDTKKYSPNVTPLKYSRGKFNFGSVFDWTERKNPTALIRAFYNAFCKNEDVTLTIRTYWKFPIEKTREYILNEVEKIKTSYVGRKVFPKILFWFDTMDERLMPNFFKSFDCFVLPTRGEGFGLPLLEAMACGVPTVGPEWGGNREFMDRSNSFLVSGKVIPINHHLFLQRQPQYSGQNWFDIDEDMLTKTMRGVYDNKDKADIIARKAVDDINKNWTWEKTAIKIYKRLLEIDNMLNAPIVVK